MQMGRLAWGIIATVVAGVTLIVATSVLGSARRTPGYIALAAGCGVLWLADHFGVMARAFREPTLGLHNAPPVSDTDETDSATVDR